MDESTATLDEKYEKQIRDCIKNLKDTTVLTITHKAECIKDYDRYVLNLL